jgi:hypothetical protein
MLVFEDGQRHGGNGTGIINHYAASDFSHFYPGNILVCYFVCRIVIMEALQKEKRVETSCRVTSIPPYFGRVRFESCSGYRLSLWVL